MTPVMAKVEVVAFWRSELPRSVVDPKRFDETELKAPATVVDADTESDVVVAP